MNQNKKHLDSDIQTRPKSGVDILLRQPEKIFNISLAIIFQALVDSKQSFALIPHRVGSMWNYRRCEYVQSLENHYLYLTRYNRNGYLHIVVVEKCSFLSDCSVLEKNSKYKKIEQLKKCVVRQKRKNNNKRRTNVARVEKSKRPTTCGVKILLFPVMTVIWVVDETFDDACKNSSPLRSRSLRNFELKDRKIWRGESREEKNCFNIPIP